MIQKTLLTLAILSTGTAALAECPQNMADTGDGVYVSFTDFYVRYDRQAPRVIGLVVELLTRRRIFVPMGRVTAIEPDADGITVHLAGRDGTASSHRFGILYPAFGVTPRTDLAVKLGLEVNEDGRLGAPTHMKAEIPGFYAAGDIVEGLDQISVAMGTGARAAVAIHNDLRQSDGQTLED